MNALAPARLDVGIHLGIPDRVYHADPCTEPSASSSILKLLLKQSEAHAFRAHPRLNPDWTPKPGTDAQNAGTILHSMVLGTPTPYRVLNVKDFKTDAAKALRAACLFDGAIPLKAADLPELQDAAASVRAQLQAMPEIWAALQDAVSNRMTEVTAIAKFGPALVRSRHDILPAPKFGIELDLKFSGLSVATEKFGKTIREEHMMQAALYPRVIEELRGERPGFVYIAAETAPPYGVSLHGLDPVLQEQADTELAYALERWARAIKTGRWPGYAPLINWHARPSWMEYAWEERMARERQFATLAKPKDGNLFTIMDPIPMQERDDAEDAL